MELSQFFVVETGADWTRWIETHGHPNPPVILVIQDHDESDAALASRVDRRIARLIAEGGCVGEFTVLRDDGRTVTARRRRRAALRDAEDHGLVLRTAIEA